MRGQYIPVIMFIAFGYMVTAPAMILLGVFSRSLNLYIRIAEVVLLAAVMLLATPAARKSNGVLGPLIVFLLVYSCRLIHDVVLKNILMIYQTPVYVLGYFFGLTLFPVVAIALLFRPQDITTVWRHSFVLLVIANVILFVYAVTTGNFEAGAFSGRIQQTGDLEGTATLGPIWIGMAGATLASMLVGLFAVGQGFSIFHQALGTALLGLCAANILFGASRGPLLAFIVSVLALALRPLIRVRGISLRESRAKTLLIAVWIGGVAVALSLYSGGSVFLIDRMFALYTDRVIGGSGVEVRDVIYATAWSDFLSSPLIGTSYVVSYDNSSPHNLILESLIATGVIGTFVLFVALFRAVQGIFVLLKGRHGTEGVSLGLATICTLIVGLTSSSIGQSPEIWIFVALVTVMSRSEASVALRQVIPATSPSVPLLAR